MNDVISCPSCGKKYRLTGPQPPSFVCRGCGKDIPIPRRMMAVPAGRVEPHPPVDPVDPVESADRGEPKGSSKRSRRRDDPMLRRLASRELGKAMQAIGAVKVLCITYAVFQAITLAFLLWVRSDTVRRAGDSPLLLDALIAVSGVMLVLLLSAIASLRTRPHLWTMVLACLQTLYLGGALLGGVGGIPLIIIVVNTLGLWAAVSVTSRVARLIREFPDLRIALKMTRGADAGRPRARLLSL